MHLVVTLCGRLAARLGALVVVAASLSGAAFAAETAPLRLCADPVDLPFSSDNAATPGLYVEIGRALAEKLGRPLQPVWSQSFFGKHNLRETLLAGQCDFAIGLPDDKDFMGPRVIFSRPFLALGYALVVPPERAVASLDDLKGQRVAVQFASSPQNLLAMRDDITMVTVLNPEEAMARLAAHEADAALVWGPVAGYLNHTTMHDAYHIVPVAGPGMQWQAAIGFARGQAALRDAVDAALVTVAPTIPALAAKYAWPQGAPLRLAMDAPPASPAADAAQIAAGRELFNGTCAHCHGPDAVQSVRRINLRLLRHRYGDDMDQVFFTTVTHGRAAKGMPNWSGVFSDDDFHKILAFLKSVQEAPQ